jgi:formate hydrogenlyase subunit 6/NADH:ubiquinone oxidoreductase subunit I
MKFKIALPIGLMVSDVLKAFFTKPVTQRYPFTRSEAPKNFRGKLIWDLSNCTGCSLCIRDCPAGAIELVVVDRATKRFIMRYYSDRCTYCAQCVVSCRRDCLRLSSEEWELASLTKTPFNVFYGRAEDVGALQQKIDEEQNRSE